MNSSPDPDERHALVRAWLAQLAPEFGLAPDGLRLATSDASFRRYFRVDAAASAGGVRSYIVMDAPPPQEDCRPFVQIGHLLAAHGVHTPQIVAADLARGFLLLTDFGDTTYADAIATGKADVAALYDDALDTLLRLQRVPPDPAVPAYDRSRFLDEMRLFPEWYVERHLGETLSAQEAQRLQQGFELLADAALAQAQVLVHRDYHCRNLMVLGAELPSSESSGPKASRTGSPGAGRRGPGVLDFQGALRGPIAYDLASLLRDAYVEWPEALQLDWAARYWEKARGAGLAVPARFDAFWRDLEWIGLQRGLKILGIFARLYHRDGKDRYLQDLPLVLRHTRRVLERYDVFADLAQLLDRIHGQARQSAYTF